MNPNVIKNHVVNLLINHGGVTSTDTVHQVFFIKFLSSANLF